MMPMYPPSMILEPDVQRLSASQTRQLAEELLLETDEATASDEDPAIVALLNERLAAYEKNPAAVSSWEDVRARVFRNHGI
jgi:putative addiction module component (TIGR02574 family)